MNYYGSLTNEATGGGGGGTTEVPIMSIKVNGEAQVPVNKTVDIKVPTKTSELLDDTHIEISQLDYDNLSDDEKLSGNTYFCMDTGNVYKRGVKYGGSSDDEPQGYAHYVKIKGKTGEYYYATSFGFGDLNSVLETGTPVTGLYGGWTIESVESTETDTSVLCDFSNCSERNLTTSPDVVRITGYSNYGLEVYGNADQEEYEILFEWNDAKKKSLVTYTSLDEFNLIKGTSLSRNSSDLCSDIMSNLDENEELILAREYVVNFGIDYAYRNSDNYNTDIDKITFYKGLDNLGSIEAQLNDGTVATRSYKEGYLYAWVYGVSYKNVYKTYKAFPFTLDYEVDNTQRLFDYLKVGERFDILYYSITAKSIGLESLAANSIEKFEMTKVNSQRAFAIATTTGGEVFTKVCYSDSVGDWVEVGNKVEDYFNADSGVAIANKVVTKKFKEVDENLKYCHRVYNTLEELNAVKGTSVEFTEGRTIIGDVYRALEPRERLSMMNVESKYLGVPEEFGDTLRYVSIEMTGSHDMVLIAYTESGKILTTTPDSYSYAESKYIWTYEEDRVGLDGKSAYDLWLEAGNAGTEQDFLDSLVGKSAYEIWLDEGNTGTEAGFLASLKGDTGKSAYEVWLDEGNTGTEQDFLDSLKGEGGVSQELVYTSLEGDLADITTVLDLVNTLLEKYRVERKNVRFECGSLNNTVLTDLPKDYGYLTIKIGGTNIVEITFAYSNLGFKAMYFGYLNRQATETLYSELYWDEVITENKKDVKGLVTNAQNFKIDLTKNNASWYGMFTFNFVYGTTPCEITVAITDKVYYTITKGQNLVSAITYTQDGANYTIGIDLTAKVYGTQVVNIPSEFGVINSLTAETFAGTTTAIIKGYGVRTYTKLSELGLTADATLDDVIATMSGGQSAAISTTEFTNYQTLFPYSEEQDAYATVNIEKSFDSSRTIVEWVRKDASKVAYGGLSSNNKVTWWNEYATKSYVDSKVVTPVINAAAGSNINTVGTPSVTASTSGNETTFTFNNLKGATGGKGDTGTRGSLWYRGTGITGTSTTATVFSGSGVSSALVNDMYLNTSTGYVYQCTVAGNASTAKWVYVGSLKGANGTTPTIKAAAGSNINSVGTPSVEASTSGTTTTFTFNNLKGAKGDKGDAGYSVFPSQGGSTQGIVCTLDTNKSVVLTCIVNGGGSVTAASFPSSGISFNGSSWTSGTKSMSVGDTVVIRNTSTSSVQLKTVNNGGLGLLVFGPF